MSGRASRSTPVPENHLPLTPWHVAAATGGAIVREGSPGAALGITTDSRAVRRGGAFLALRGERVDGHAYVEAALRAGATLLVVERGRGPGAREALASDVGVVEVDDTLVAWGDLARAHLRALRAQGTKVVAITGSAGKTTTKELCAALLRTQAATLATAGNLNNRIGLPATALAATSAHVFLVLEVGMSLRGEIATLASIAEPDVALIVNVGVAHAEGVGGTRADVAREKGALVAALRTGGVAIANGDDPAALGQLARTVGRPVVFGTAPTADIVLAAREITEHGAQLTITRRDGSTLATAFPLAGHASALDFCGALAAAEAALGRTLSGADVERALQGVGTLAGRFARHELPGGITIFDDTYNANPTSVRAALATLAEVAGTRRKVVVLGEMKELGVAALDEHRGLGDAIASAGVELAVGCGGLIDRALERAGQLGVTVVHAATVTEAAQATLQAVRPGDAVLVKASRSVGAERVVETLVHGVGNVGREA